MTGIIIVCMLHYNAAWFFIDIRREDIVVHSQVECNNLAIEKGKRHSGIGTVMSYDMSREGDRKQLTIRCGEDAKDCRGEK